MTLPAAYQDVWTLATMADKEDVLISLGNLPKGEAASAEIEDASFLLAMEGTTRHGLAEAVKAVFQNKLGHKFHPLPQELRFLHDQAMSWHEAQREKIARREQMERERPVPKPKLSAEERARQIERMRRFHESTREDYDKAVEEARRVDIRQRYGMTDECLASIPSQGEGRNWQRAGGR